MFCKSRPKLETIHVVNRRNKPLLQEVQDNSATQNNNQKNKEERIERRKARKIRTNIQKLERHLSKYRGNNNTTLTTATTRYCTDTVYKRNNTNLKSSSHHGSRI